jgi:hypothetical protein
MITVGKEVAQSYLGLKVNNGATMLESSVQRHIM